MNVTVTGATGFIGTRLMERLRKDGHQLTVLSRKARSGGGARYVTWDPGSGDAPAAAFENCDAVIHLAGEPVAQRWTAAVKQRIRSSRVEGTERLVRTLSRLERKPKVLVSGSAIGYYGPRGDEVLTEASPAGTDYLAGVSVDWEKAAMAAERDGIRVATIRTGIVLGKGGALQSMLPPFKAGVGGRLSDGKQWMSWIHIDDLIGLIVFALETPGVRGPLNGTAPEPVTNADFTQELAAALHRPAIFPVPAFALKLLFGEMSRVILASQRVMPEAARHAGFGFRYPELGPALKDVLKD